MIQLRREPDALSAAIRVASEQTGIPARQIRKDFWLTEALRGCAQTATDLGVQVIFKGGTSLSKVFGIIERFSEDVDLLVVAPGGDQAVDTTMKRLALGAEEASGLESTLDKKTASTGKFRAYRLPFPDRRADDEGVLLEIGSRGGALPSRPHELASIVAPVAASMTDEPIEEAARFEVQVLDPARTLVEKLVILQEAHHRAEPARAARVNKVARHYYDVFRLLGDDDVRTALGGHGTGVLAREVCQHSKAIGLPAVSYPKGGFAGSAAFKTQSTASQRKAYNAQVPQLVWPGSDVPEFAACLARVEEFADLL